MALQAYADAQANALSVYKAPELTPEELERRAKEAEVLEEKLRIINEKARRREQERLAQLDEEWEERQKQEEYERRQAELKEMDEQRTAKRRAKRQKRKAKKKGKGGDGSAHAEQDSGSDENDTKEQLSVPELD